MILRTDISQLPILSEGGEGIIYEYNSQLIKFYKPHVNRESKAKKIRMLMKKQLPTGVVAPLDVVYDKNRNFVGYVMDRINGEEFKKLSNKKFVTANGITKKEILYMLKQVYEILQQLHSQNIYIGDLNDQNILFDKSYQVYIIDCDSWTIDDEKCEVAMDLFKDPLLKKNDFDAKTDTYAFSILSWKALTRIHPFGGTMQPDMNIMDRMKKGISVIDNSNVIIPRTISSWAGLSPELINALKAIFENRSRELNDEIQELYNHLAFCKVDKDYYYDRYNICPVCDSSAQINKKPISQGVQSGLRLIELLVRSNIKIVINENTYIDNDDYIVNVRTGKKVKYKNMIKYYFDSNDVLIECGNSSVIIHSDNDYVFEKKYKSNVVVEGNKLYYISKKNTLIEVTITQNGNNIRNVCKCSNNCYFEVSHGKYFVINYYQGKIVFNNNGVNCEYEYSGKIENYGIHYDVFTDKWLVVIENETNKFLTLVFKNNEIQYKCDRIRFECPLGNICISNNTLFFPIDGNIRGFAYQKDLFKDFQCDVVNNDSRLIKDGKKFIIVNDENIYALS